MHAVKDLNFTVEKGEYIAVIGHTGSGKSTLIQMLNGLIKPTSGTVYFEGNNIWDKKYKIRDLRFKVGLCFQYPEYQLFEETVYKDIAFGPTNMGLSGDELYEAVRTAALFAGLKEKYLDSSPFELSGGQKRRAAIAGVIAMSPQVLILDEPTAGLDPHGRDKILAGINEYRKATGATVILVTHSMEDAAANADRLLVLNSGEIEYFDTCKRVFSHAQRLTEIGLDIPQSAKLMLKLRSMGYAVPEDVYNIKEAQKALLPFLVKGGADNA